MSNALRGIHGRLLSATVSSDDYNGLLVATVLLSAVLCVSCGGNVYSFIVRDGGDNQTVVAQSIAAKSTDAHERDTIPPASTSNNPLVNMVVDEEEREQQLAHVRKLEQRIASLEKELDLTTVSRDSITKQHASCGSTIASLQTQLAEANNSTAALTKQVADLEKQCQALAAQGGDQLQKLQAELEVKSRELAASMAEQERLAKQVKALQEEAKAAAQTSAARIAELEKSAQSSQTSLQTSNTRISELERQLQNETSTHQAASKVSSSRIIELETALKSSQDSASTASERLTSALARIAALEKEVASHQAAIEDHKLKIANAKSEHQAAIETHASKLAHAMSAHQAESHAKKEVQDKLNEAEQGRLAAEQMLAELKKEQEKEEALEHEATSALRRGSITYLASDPKYDALLARIRNLEADLEKALHTVGTLEVAKERHLQEIDELTTEMESLEQNNNVFAAVCKRMNQKHRIAHTHTHSLARTNTQALYSHNAYN